MDMRDLLQKDLEYQEQLMKYYRKELRVLPKGTLYVKNNGTKSEYYSVDRRTRKRKYIKKKNDALVEGLKKRRFIEDSIKAMESNLAIQRKLLDIYRPYDYASITSKIPLAYRLETKDDGEVLQSMKHYENEVLHKTTLGLYVRSKSEAVICEAIASADMKFKYEKELVLFKEGNAITVRPDFSFENIVTGEEFYWEHLGMLSNEEYKRSNIEKLMLYAENDILIGRNLFITADSLKGELDMRVIMRTVEMIKTLI